MILSIIDIILIIKIYYSTYYTMDILFNFFKKESGSNDVPSIDLNNITLDNEALVLKSKLLSEIGEFESFKKEVKSYMNVIEDVETFVNHPIDVVEKTLYVSLLPKYENKFISLMAYVKLHKAMSDKKQRDDTLFSLDVLMYILHEDSGMDCFDLLIGMNGANMWPSNRQGGLSSMTMSASRLTHIVNDGILIEGGDMAQQMVRLEKNSGINSQIKALSDISRAISVL